MISRNQIFSKIRLPFPHASREYNKFKPCLCKLYTGRQERLKRVSLPGQQQFECVPSHLYIWHRHLGPYLAAVEKGRQEETREKGACVSYHKTIRTEEMAVLRMQGREKPGDVKGKRHCWHSIVMVVPVPAIWSLPSVWLPQPLEFVRSCQSCRQKQCFTKHWPENFIEAQSLCGEPGENSGSKNSPPTISFQILKSYI